MIELEFETKSAARRVRAAGLRAGTVLGAAVGLLGLTLAQPADAGGMFGNGLEAIQVGGIVILAPEYEGSKHYRVLGAPIVAPAGSLGDGDGGLVQFRGPSDIRFRLFDYAGFEFGPVAGYRFGRDEDDGDLLAGLGDVDGGIVLGGFAAYRAGLLRAFASYQHQVTGDDTGGVLDFGVEATVPVSARAGVRGTVGATWASDDYQSAFFGISDFQEARSRAGLDFYDADAGIKDVYLSLAADVDLGYDWTLKLMGRYSRLVGDAADSPIVESEDQFMAGLGLTYRFPLAR